LIDERTAKPVEALPQKIELVNREAVARERGEGGPPESYVKAFGFFSANNYHEAITAFEEFIRTNPANEYAGNARYWIGECFYTQKEYPKALASFQSVIDNYPKGNKVADAMLKVAFSHISMNEPDKAKLVLEGLIRKFPKSPAAAKARERLNRH
jgi:tol-pal system protein YbgF